MSINKLKLNGSVYDLDVLINGSSVSSVVSQLSSKFGDYTETSDLANVATSGSYNDLTDAPLTTALVEMPWTYTYNDKAPAQYGFYYNITNQDGSVATFIDGEEYQVTTTINGNVYQYTATAADGQIQDPQHINNISYNNNPEYLSAWSNVNGFIDNIGEYTAADVQIVIKKKGLVLNGVLPVSTFTNDIGYITSASIDTQITNAVSGKANTADLATVATTGDYADLINTPIVVDGTKYKFAKHSNTERDYIVMADTANGTVKFGGDTQGSVADGGNSVVMGTNNTNKGWNNFIFGSDNRVEGRNNFVGGAKNSIGNTFNCMMFGTNNSIGTQMNETFFSPGSRYCWGGAQMTFFHGLRLESKHQTCVNFGMANVLDTDSYSYNQDDEAKVVNYKLFVIGNGKVDDQNKTDAQAGSKRVRHNAFEVRKSGDIYIADTNASGAFYQKPMIKLQDKLTSLESAVSSESIASAVSSAAASAGYVTSSSLSTVATSGSYNDLTDKPTIPAEQIQADWNQADTTAVDYIKNKPTIPSLTGYATETWVSNKLNDILGIDASGVSSLVSILEDSDTTTGILNTIANKADKSSTVSNVAWDSTNAKLTKTINGTTTDIVTAATILGKLTSSQVINALGYTPSSSDSDTKNTTGSSNKTSTKMFLVGATSQATSPVTYSNSNCYIGSDNCLYSNGSKVITSHQDISTKVDKVTGQGLSTNDYTTAEKNKLGAISASVSGKVLTITTTA